MIQKGEYIRDLFDKPVGTAVTAHGWVKTRRDSKGVHFIQLSDGSCFQDLGFPYLQTPIITASDCEGAGAMFGVTTLDLMNLPRTPAGGVDFGEDFFGKPAFLTVSGQLEAEIYALAFANVYAFGPTFRAENSNTPRHLAEFWMIEPEMAFCDLDDNRRLAEAFLKAIIGEVLDRCAADLEFFNKRIDNTVLET